MTRPGSFFRLNIDYGERVYGLDVVRSLAILIVILGHCSIFLKPWHEEVIPFLNVSVYRTYNTLVNGFDGVDLFFVLSGFLIGGIFIRLMEKSTAIVPSTISNFWKRRWLRTIPAYFFVLTVNLIVYVGIVGNTNLDSGTLSYYMFCQNLLTGGLDFFPESWSLSVEEWFYITLPITFYAAFQLAKRWWSKKHIFLVMALFYLLAVTSFRLYYTRNGVEDWNTEVRTAVLMRLDTIMFGVIAAWIKFYHSAYWHKFKRSLFAIGIILLLLNFYIGFIHTRWHYHNFFMNSFYYSVIGLSAMFLLPLADSVKTGRGTIHKWLTTTSVISYSMYLINYSLILAGIKYFIPTEEPSTALAGMLLFLTLVYLLSALLYKYVERPFLKYRDRITTRDSI